MNIETEINQIKGKLKKLKVYWSIKDQDAKIQN